MTGKEWNNTMKNLLKALESDVTVARLSFERMIEAEGMDSEAGMVDFTEIIFEDVPKLLKQIEEHWNKGSEITPDKENEE